MINFGWHIIIFSSPHTYKPIGNSLQAEALKVDQTQEDYVCIWKDVCQPCGVNNEKSVCKSYVQGVSVIHKAQCVTILLPSFSQLTNTPTKAVDLLGKSFLGLQLCQASEEPVVKLGFAIMCTDTACLSCLHASLQGCQVGLTFQWELCTCPQDLSATHAKCVQCTAMHQLTL